MTSIFQKYLKEHSTTDSVKCTHTCMAGQHGGKFIIENYSEFYELYLKAIESGGIYFLSERITGCDYFHFFLLLLFT